MKYKANKGRIDDNDDSRLEDVTGGAPIDGNEIRIGMMLA